MFPALASRIALRSRALPSGSPPPERAATVISLMNFVNSLPRLASSAPFLCLILCHFECPDICESLFLENRNCGRVGHAIYQIIYHFSFGHWRIQTWKCNNTRRGVSFTPRLQPGVDATPQRFNGFTELL